MKINKEWHKENPMPKKATIEERFAWHIEHAKNCSCRKMPTKLMELMQQKTTIPDLLLKRNDEEIDLQVND